MRRRNGKSGANRTKLILSRMVPNRQTYYLSLSGCSPMGRRPRLSPHPARPKTTTIHLNPSPTPPPRMFIIIIPFGLKCFRTMWA